MRFTLTLSAAVLITFSTQAMAADNACPSGNIEQVRTSEIIPGGTAEGFKSAVAAHAKWFVDHGYKADKFLVGQVMQADAKTKTLSAVPNQFMTFHYHATYIDDNKHDAAWDAFVAKYKANSKIVSTTLLCMGN